MEYALKVIAGPDEGTTIPVRPGRTMIGRSNEARLQLADPVVSWEHAVVSLNKGRISIENLSAHGTEVNNRKLTGTTLLHAHDRIGLSQETVLSMQSASNAQESILSGAAMKLLLAVAALVVVGLFGLMLIETEQEVEVIDDWNGAYVYLESWVAQQVRADALPQAVLVRFRDGWRHEHAGKPVEAAQAWSEVAMLLGAIDAKMVDSPRPVSELADQSPGALDSILQGGGADPGANDDQNVAALLQFARRSFTWNAKKAAQQEEEEW